MFYAHQGAELLMTAYEPDVPPLGVIQIVHGFGEYSGTYDELMTFFMKHGYIAVIHDQRGHGALFQGKNAGIVSSYDDMLCDIETVRSHIQQKYPGLPISLIGHSMGGNAATYVAINDIKQPYKNVILEAPWFELYQPLSPVMHKLAKILGQMSPRFTKNTKLDRELVTRDPEAQQMMAHDILRHHTMSLRLISRVLDIGRYNHTYAHQLRTPTLLMIPEKDQICSTDAMRTFAQCAGDIVTVKEYPGGYHCLHHDLNKQDVFNDMHAFIKGNALNQH